MYELQNKLGIKILADVGNNQRYICLNKLHEKLGKQLF